jgi:hypothetical protein
LNAAASPPRGLRVKNEAALTQVSQFLTKSDKVKDFWL